jgi:hypothetical protein
LVGRVTGRPFGCLAPGSTCRPFGRWIDRLFLGSTPGWVGPLAPGSMGRPFDPWAGCSQGGSACRLAGSPVIGASGSLLHGPVGPWADWPPGCWAQGLALRPLGPWVSGWIDSSICRCLGRSHGRSTGRWVGCWFLGLDGPPAGRLALWLDARPAVSSALWSVGRLTGPTAHGQVLGLDGRWSLGLIGHWVL